MCHFLSLTTLYKLVLINGKQADGSLDSKRLPLPKDISDKCAANVLTLFKCSRRYSTWSTLKVTTHGRVKRLSRVLNLCYLTFSYSLVSLINAILLCKRFTHHFNCEFLLAIFKRNRLKFTYITSNVHPYLQIITF